jgi:hypothetical protein
MARVLFGIIAAVFVYGLWFTPSAVGDRLGLRRFLTPEITGTTRVGQHFAMSNGGLSAIELRPAAVGEVAGVLRFTLVNENRIVHTAELPAADFVRDERFTFVFPPQPDSRGRDYELYIDSSPEQPATGVALWATRGDRVPGAWLIINSASRWASLAFQTHTPNSTPLIYRVVQSSGARRVRLLFVLGCLIGTWLLVGVILRAIATMPEPAGGDPVEPSRRPAPIRETGAYASAGVSVAAKDLPHAEEKVS